MEVLPRAIATVSVAASAAGMEGPASGSGRRNHVQVTSVVTPAVPFLRSVSAFAASLLAAARPAALALNVDDVVTNVAPESAASEPLLVDVPSVDVPSVELPSVQLPNVELPSVELPNIQLPNVELPNVDLPSIDLPAVDFGGASGFVSDNPLALVGVLAAIALPLVAARAFAGPASFGSVSAVEAYEKLSDPEQNAQLLDIRAPQDIKAEGSPNLKALRKKPLRVAYAAKDDAFVEKVLAKCKIAEDTTLYVLDSFDGSSATVAKLLANSGFKSAYSIRGGAEGQNGWRGKELPWSAASTSFNLNFDGLKDIIKPGQGVDADGIAPAALGVAAVTGVGLIVLSEAETALQLLGTVAVLQLFAKKFLFAEDRKKTIQDIKTYLDTKIAPKEFVAEIQEVGRAILPSDGEVKAAVETGAAVLEKELDVDSVTPEALAEKAREKAGEVGSDLKAGAGSVIPESLTEKAEEVGSDLKAGVDSVTPESLAEKAEEVGSDLKAGVDSVTPESLAEKAEEVGSDLKAGVDSVTPESLAEKAEEVGSDLKEGAEEAKSAVESTTESVKSSNGSAAPAPGAVEEEKPAKVEVTSKDQHDSAQSAFEGDEPSSLDEGGIGEDVAAEKLKAASSSVDSSS